MAGRVRCLHQGANTLGEGPLWHQGRLYWVDILARQIHALHPDSGQHRSWLLPDRIGFLVPAASGQFIGGLKRGLARIDLRGDAPVLTDLGTPEADRPGNRFNDAKCDRQGRLWAGTMNDGNSEPTGWLYRYTPEEGFRAVDGPYCVTNGPAISPDGKTLYHSDSSRRVIYAFDLHEARGELSGRRPFVQLGASDGFPDGMTTDAAGCLWVAKFGGWGLDRYRPDGSLAERIDLPVRNVTSCAFGGERLDRLFVTTARLGQSAEELAAQPLAGGLFEVEQPGAVGVPAGVFRG
jgi:sugar lactone lactonase YvrE